MPRRKPRNLDAYRYELGTYERQLAKDMIMVQGIKALAVPIGAGFVGVGLAMAGFFAYNKVDDLKEWADEQWKTGFGLQADPAIIQDSVGNQVSTGNDTSSEFDGLSVHSIYSVHYEERTAIIEWASRQWCRWNGLEWTGPNHALFLNDIKGKSSVLTTYRFERNELIQTATSENAISEYVYQMIIRETDSRNTQARVISGIVGTSALGIGAVFSEATSWALRSAGFMNRNGWDGQKWEEAPGANFDPLLNFAWARTNFQTGEWWSTVDAVGDLAFWMDRDAGVQGYTIDTNIPNPMGFKKWSYEQLIHQAHNELASGTVGPFLLNILGAINVGFIIDDDQELDESIPTGESSTGNKNGQHDQNDDRMPGEDEESDRGDSYGPPR